MNLSECRRYFNRKKPTGAVALLIFGILVFGLNISSNGRFQWILIGAGMSACGIYLTFKFSATQREREIDNFCSIVANEYWNDKRFIVHSEGNDVTDAIYSSGYCFENIFGARQAIQGRDNIWRSSIFEMACMFFAKEKIYYYSKKISLITDEKFEKHRDFRLQDIQMVSIEENNQSLAVAVVFTGNEKIYVNCRTKEEAIRLCARIKEKTQRRS